MIDKYNTNSSAWTLLISDEGKVHHESVMGLGDFTCRVPGSFLFSGGCQIQASTPQAIQV
jgi:hypothetical protein